MNRRAISLVAVLALAVFGGRTWLASDAAVDQTPTSTKSAVAHAFAARSQGEMLEFDGTVVRLLGDDADGSRHQHFLVRTQADIVVLVAHNVELAPPIRNLDRGDRMRLRGQYEWNEKGGVLHWTRHVAIMRRDGSITRAGATSERDVRAGGMTGRRADAG